LYKFSILFKIIDFLILCWHYYKNRKNKANKKGKQGETNKNHIEMKKGNKQFAKETPSAGEVGMSFSITLSTI
jgi:hypothetical protein